MTAAGTSLDWRIDGSFLFAKLAHTIPEYSLRSGFFSVVLRSGLPPATFHVSRKRLSKLVLSISTESSRRDGSVALCEEPSALGD